jgi:hypothetical protein
VVAVSFAYSLEATHLRVFVTQMATLLVLESFSQHGHSVNGAGST